MIGEVCVVTPESSEGKSHPASPSSCSGGNDLSKTTDHLRVLLAQEESSYGPCLDYLSAIQTSNDSVDRVSEAWRRKLCEWCYEVVDHFGFDREVVSIALNYLDRVVAVRTESSQSAIPKREFQLFAVTSLYTAIKIHGENDNVQGPRRKLRIDAFVELSRGFFQVEVIEAMERELLSALNWRVNPPTMLRFVSNYLRLFPSYESSSYKSSQTIVSGIYDVARYLTELSVCVSSFGFSCKASVTAFSAILCAVEALQQTYYISPEIQDAFLSNLAMATGLHADMHDVRRAQEMLKDLCPSMFKDGSLPQEFYHSGYVNNADPLGGDGKISPVSVVIEAPHDTPNSRRKRSRSNIEERASARP
jgi:Cyclin, N-terminal domain